jgi:hypothetical protein
MRINAWVNTFDDHMVLLMAISCLDGVKSDKAHGWQMKNSSGNRSMVWIACFGQPVLGPEIFLLKKHQTFIFIGD